MVELGIDGDRGANYKLMVAAAREFLRDEEDVVANLANISALIYQYMEDINWVGFYVVRKGVLVLGPFQGRPACVRIGAGKGVCGAAVSRREVVVVDDVSAFPGHIVCDSASNSEIVLPLYIRGEVYGVLDVDSPSFARFGKAEEQALGNIATAISSFLEENA